MSYTKCEPGKASGLGFAKVGVHSAYSCADNGEANKRHKVYTPIPQLQWARHPRTGTFRDAKSGARVFMTK